ncbi:hypothetical protein FHS51_002281 [Sphingobium wenxiniae]|uniref:Arm DNA-binding domain-containing protein n=1 Tax=Sphingobium TaxID=165695 RepID=UPI00161B4913|nr:MULTISPECIES: Arm DNA-binding domain-containing protein [Sphingobium]MBB6192049.1 hypothetical protein [Sphingobium wenxiniae]WRD76023.1 Arm DNA-binding domain-containing protein [Sphingobium baderi]
MVEASGGKLWRLKYGVDGEEKKLGLGTYPEVSLGDARKGRDGRGPDTRDAPSFLASDRAFAKARKNAEAGT